MINKTVKFLLTILILSVGLGAAAGAITPVIPADSAINPANGVLYVVDNSVPRIKVYKRSSVLGWSEVSSEHEALPAGSKCYGLEIDPAGTKLYASINNSSASRIRVYSLDGTGYPTSYTDITGIYFTYAPDSSPAGLALGGNNRLFVADLAKSRVLVFDTQSNTFVKALTGELKTDGANPYDIATTSTSDNSYKIYISHKFDPGAIYVYEYNSSGDTLTFVNKLNNRLSDPTYLAVAGDKLFVAANGTSGDDVQVYSTSDETLIGTVQSGATGSYGWTSIAVSGDDLYLKKALNRTETSNKLYRQKISDISGTVTATELADVIGSDGIKLTADGSWLALSNSANGAVEFKKLSDIITPPAMVTDFDASDGEDSQSTLTWTNPSDSNLARVIVVRTTNPVTIPGDLPQIDASGNILQGTIVYDVSSPAPGSPATHADTGLTNGSSYAYSVFSGNSEGNWNTTVDIVGPEKNTDVGYPLAGLDITPPAAITDLIATPGSSGGEVDLTWTAPGDDGMTGSVSQYRVRYITSSIPLVDAFAGGFEDARASEYSTSGWGALASGGSAENRTMTGLPYDAGTPTYIYIAIIAADERPNWSDISNIASTFVKDSIPAPAVTRIYPNRAPNAGDTDIVIEGENLVSPADVQLKTTSPTALTNVAVISLNRIEATVPAGVDPGTYHITVTTPGGESPETPADEFTVMDGPEDPPTPSQVIDFRVVSGNGQCVLSWTNPSDMDMASITVRRAGPYALPEDPSNYPADKTAGYEVGPAVISGVIPTPGAAVQFTDSGLTNDQVYYYVVYITDTSGNASALDYDTAGGQNAATGKPAAGANPPVSLTFDAGRGNIFWISVPYDTPAYTTVSDIIADINTQAGEAADSGNVITSVGRWIGTSNPQVYESYDYLGILGWSGSDFALVPGEALYLNIAASTTFTLQGSHDPAFVFDLPFDAARGNVFWVSLPYSGDFTDAASIIADLNTSAGLPVDDGTLVNSIGRWNGSTQAYESYDYLGIIGWSGNNFSYEPVEGYYINIAGNVNTWSPSTH